MNLARLLVPWWAHAHANGRIRHDDADAVTKRLAVHAQHLRELTSELEAEIRDLKQEAHLE